MPDTHGTNEALRDEYRLLFEHTGTAMMVIEEDMTVSMGNRKMEQMTGYTQDEIPRRKKWTDYVCPEYHEKMLAYHRLRRENAPGVPDEYEFAVRHADGSIRDVWATVNIIPGTKKSLVSLIDVTELKKAERALRESETRFRDLYENANDIIYIHDFEGTFISANAAALRTYGYEGGEVGRLTIRDIVDPEYLPIALARMQEKKSAKKISEPYELLTHTKQGAPVWIEVSTRVIGEGTKPIGVQGIARDITERRSAEQRLRDSEQRFRDMADLLPTVVCELDPSLVVTYVNKIGLELFGYSREELKRGISVARLIYPDDLEIAQRKISEVLTGAWVAAAEFRLVRRDGSAAPFLVSCSPVYCEGKVCGIRSSLLDLSERKQLEEMRLKQAQDEAKKAGLMVEALRKEMRETFSFGNMVSRSPQMRRIFDLLPEMARSPSTVLVSGESGTGKELIARALHDLGPRAGKPFVAINCSALPDTLLESELFGYKAGAFTDAKKDKPGKFALAQGGTIFLDEIGDISAAMQAKLLRVLQEKTFEPLGAGHSVKADVRVVAATNRNLPAMVKEGRFRDDLYYRINVLRVQLPPLRERRCDIPILCNHLVDVFNGRYARHVEGLSQEVLDALLAWDFSGNIRELENIIEHAFVFCKGTIVELEHMPPEFSSGARVVPAGDLARIGGFEELERLYINSVLAECGGNRIRAAEKLGVHRATLFRKMKRLGIAAGEEQDAAA